MIAFHSDVQTIDRLRGKFPFVEPIFVHRKFDRGARVHRWIATHILKTDYVSSNRLSRWIGRYPLHIICDRYFLALKVVTTHRNMLSNVMLCDSRDVIFQGDPFRWIQHKLISGLEPKTIGNCSHNTAWIRQLYGTDIFGELCNKTIVCAGVTLGPVKEIERYLHEMCKEIWVHLAEVTTSRDLDQGVHNYLIHKKAFPCELTDNQSGLIATLHHENPTNISIDEAGGLIKVRGKYPIVVHQYDRHPCLVRWLEKSVWYP
ncbi:MAG TPA: hypothetical protein VNM15_06465 [Candidatus Binatia bacterium]|nr:hypothetical protein [Candidatus Binatia bacterium]